MRALRQCVVIATVTHADAVRCAVDLVVVTVGGAAGCLKRDVVQVLLCSEIARLHHIAGAVVTGL